MGKELIEIHSAHIGVRIKPSAAIRLKNWASHFNMPPAIFVRQLLLNRLDELDAAEKK